MARSEMVGEGHWRRAEYPGSLEANEQRKVLSWRSLAQQGSAPNCYGLSENTLMRAYKKDASRTLRGFVPFLCLSLWKVSWGFLLPLCVSTVLLPTSCVAMNLLA